MATAPLRALYIPVHLLFAFGAAVVAERFASAAEVLTGSSDIQTGSIILIAIAAVLSALPAMRGKTWVLTAFAALPWLMATLYTRSSGYGCFRGATALSQREVLGHMRMCVANTAELHAVGAAATVGLVVVTLITMLIARRSHNGRLAALAMPLGILGGLAGGLAVHSLGRAGQLSMMASTSAGLADQVRSAIALGGRAVPVAILIVAIAGIAALLLRQHERGLPPPPKFGAVRGQGAIVALSAAVVVCALAHWNSGTSTLETLSTFKPVPPKTVVMQPVLPPGAVISNSEPMLVGDVPLTAEDVTSTSPVVIIDAGIAPAMLAARLEELKPHTTSLQVMGVRSPADRLPVSDELQPLLYDDERAVKTVAWCTTGGPVNDGSHTLGEVLAAPCVRFSK